MDSIMRDTGSVVGDPSEVHKTWTEHFTNYYKIPEEFKNELHRADDWMPIITDRQRFMLIHSNSNIPQWCLDTAFDALQVKPGALQVRSTLSVSLEPPPTVEDLYKSIRHTKTNSAPGPSGLSYNMLKSFPREMVEYVHSLLAHYWLPGPKPKSWKWRWLHLIPKTIKDVMGLNDCRPLMLCEVYRKIWSNILLSRLMSAFYRHGIFEEIQHSFSKKRDGLSFHSSY
jgi:hypothetical protein